MNIKMLTSVLEALIMVSDAPLSAEKLYQLIEEPKITLAKVKEALVTLQTHYEDRGIELKEVASGYRFQACAAYQTWFHRLLEEKPQRYSKALLETLAIVAYRQPVTRADVEAVRGVAVSSSIMKTLLEREWIRVVGHRDVPGRPCIYATTKTFLDYFGLCSLSELPALAEIKELSELMQEGDQALSEVASNLQAHKKEDIETLNHLTTQSVDAEVPTLIQDEAFIKAET